MLDPLDASFRTALARKVQDEHKDRLAQLAVGSANTFENYRERVGYLRALTDVTEWCKEVAKTMAANP